MKRDKKDIESDIKKTLNETFSLVKEYISCEDKQQEWAKNSLDVSIDGLEAIRSFLKKQRSKFKDKDNKEPEKNHENIIITETE